MTDTWHFKVVGDGLAAIEPSNRIFKAFQNYIQTGCMREDMGVFSHYNLSLNVVTLYFPPSVAMLAKEFGAQSCHRPAIDHQLTLLAGNKECWRIHFPNSQTGRSEEDSGRLSAS